jgi:hypothetical protein
VTPGTLSVGLIAVLCDQRRYETALPFAQRAVMEHPDSAPAQTVAARCFDEFAATLGAGDGTSSAALEPVRRVAAEMRRRARELEPREPAEALQWRRERPFPPPVVYAHALTANAGTTPQGTSATGREMTPDNAEQDSSSQTLADERAVGVWRRLLRMLAGRGSSC